MSLFLVIILNLANPILAACRVVAQNPEVVFFEVIVLFREILELLVGRVVTKDVSLDFLLFGGFLRDCDESEILVKILAVA